MLPDDENDTLVLRAELRAAMARIHALEAELGRLKGRRFRIMEGPSIPWRMIEPHEVQALANHDQTLEQLHGRGGLSCAEAVAVLEDKPWRSVRNMSDDEAKRRLNELMRAFEAMHEVANRTP